MTVMRSGGHIRAEGTPIPRVDRESQRVSSPVFTYQASPEMLERYRAMPGLRDKRRTTMKTFAEEKLEEESIMAIELTKEQYLEKRLSGKNRNQIAQEYGYKNSGALYVRLSQWGLKDPADEARAIREFAGEQVNEPQPVDAQPTLVEPTDGPTEQPATTENDQPVSETQETDSPVRPWLQKDVVITVTLTEAIVKHAVQALIEEAYDTAVEHGWHDELVPLPIRLALIHSEVSEALNADRKNEGPEAVAEELADVVIRVFDTAAEHQLDLAGALFRKMMTNREREWRHGGRKY